MRVEYVLYSLHSGTQKVLLASLSVITVLNQFITMKASKAPLWKLIRVVSWQKQKLGLLVVCVCVCVVVCVC